MLYQTPGTLSPNLCYWSSSLCGVCFTKIISLSLSFLFLSAINHMILVVEYGKKNCKGWILFDGKHIYIYLYIALNIFINMYVIMRDWDIVFIMSFICTISCIALPTYMYLNDTLGSKRSKILILLNKNILVKWIL